MQGLRNQTLISFGLTLILISMCGMKSECFSQSNNKNQTKGIQMDLYNYVIKNIFIVGNFILFKFCFFAFNLTTDFEKKQDFGYSLRRKLQDKYMYMCFSNGKACAIFFSKFYSKEDVNTTSCFLYMQNIGTLVQLKKKKQPKKLQFYFSSI